MTGTHYYLQDHLGSTTALTNSSGSISTSIAYDAYGNSTPNSLTRYGYTGRELDPDTGLMYYRARWYDPQLGRFISEDPIGFASGDTNFYAYVANNPINKIDPFGLDDADRDWAERNSPPTPNPWYWSHNESADNPPLLDDLMFGPKCPNPAVMGPKHVVPTIELVDLI